ncbi:zinc finger BED domain-containing 1-like [Brachionus plicatilis]|uniref:Zinc finger BED domain-containing 1-like n=1 Tax=Brachionus plicatilis TaxID=10195 RepID=A0A3M7QJA9_BRAPC|nr:zinc finger BED domain-containing 1-like [Brachionus plicatilis]
MKSKEVINTETNEKILFNHFDPDTNSMQFWSKNKTRFPRLSELVLKFSSIPASSSPVERLFSKSC